MMGFEVGDTVIWDKDYKDVGVIKELDSENMKIQWSRAGVLTYSKQYWYRVKVVEKNKAEFKTIQVVSLVDHTGTTVEYKGRKYKLILVE